MKWFGVVGWKGSGKTTLVVKLLPELNRRGLIVSTLKHAHHSFDIDEPGRDSYEHRAAGATEVMVSSAHRWALMHENQDGSEAALDELVAKMKPVDLLLIEGFKREAFDKLEVHRKVVGKPLLAPDDPNIIAVAADHPMLDFDRPQLDINDVVGIADFIIDWCGLLQLSQSHPQSTPGRA
ncbi:MAG: molybdopterin-guanine dinucleotide biosynthesis protein B [Proteobacteria bacterium]|nr:molybdopterin-guanine dinucleotide biosynthesis protein B [Pseudomonadota bacterium]MDA1060005.1 molybdopterin-guanine dinucleotide biosynthesis protein B [Pseudomonadota bacterium]